MVLTFGPGSAADAHANFARSDPAPNAHLTSAPARVDVVFSEQFAPASSDLALLDSDGREIASHAQTTSDPTELVLPLPRLPDGVYTLAWHTVSAVDGDAAKGYFAFEVGITFSSPAAPAAQVKAQGDIAVSLAVVPSTPGRNGYQVTAMRSGAPLANVTRVRLRVTPLDRDIGQSENVLASSGAGTYGGSGFELPFAGRYTVQVQVRRSDTLDDLAFDFAVQVRSAPASASPTAAPSGSAVAIASPSSAAAGPGLPLAAVIAAVVLALAAAVLIAWARKRA